MDSVYTFSVLNSNLGGIFTANEWEVEKMIGLEVEFEVTEGFIAKGNIERKEIRKVRDGALDGVEIGFNPKKAKMVGRDMRVEEWLHVERFKEETEESEDRDERRWLVECMIEKRWSEIEAKKTFLEDNGKEVEMHGLALEGQPK